MLGAIAGDIIGSVHEYAGTKTKSFPLFQARSHFTDDSVLTIALADSILHGWRYANVLREYVQRYPNRDYGRSFFCWALGESKAPYNSFGNGSAMRVSPVGFAYNDLDQVLEKAKESAAITHSHPEGIKGAQATASAIFLARMKKSKEEIRRYIETAFHYDLDEPLDHIRAYYAFDETCQGTVPQAIRAFLESEDFEDAIRNAVSLGGDSDTLACITGGIAEAFYQGVPGTIAENVCRLLDEPLLSITNAFRAKYCAATLA